MYYLKRIGEEILRNSLLKVMKILTNNICKIKKGDILNIITDKNKSIVELLFTHTDTIAATSFQYVP